MRTNHAPRSRAFWTASALFFLSGAAGLAYEVIWFKRFSHLWGNSTLAMAVVVASFLFGLGAGARLLGPLADRVASPLRWYGLCEAGIGLLALAVPAGLHLTAPLAAGLHEPLVQHPILYSLARFLVTFAVIGPACLLMGATLPLLVRQFVPAGAEIERATAWLYGINTLGAATGCYLTGFHLLPAFGLESTNAGTAMLNFLIGVAAVASTRAMFLHAEARPDADTEATPVRSPLAEPDLADVSHPRATVLAIALITGAAALVLQVVWNRQLGLILGGSTYAFTAMLFVMLIGIGLGSLVHHSFLRRSRRPVHLSSLVILSIMVTTVIGQAAIPRLTAFVGVVLPLRTSNAFGGVLATSISAALQLLPALGMGMLFPLLVELARDAKEDAGAAVGALYGWNTLGAILGATLTALVLFPALGTARTVTLALGLYAVSALVLLPRAERRATGRAMVGAAATVVIALSALLWNVDPRTTNWGMFMYGYLPAEELGPIKTLLFREGSSANVLVVENTRDGNHSLRVNGKVDASDGDDMLMQVGSAYVPRFLRPDARDVLVIGFGSGTTVGASLLFPDTRVTCTEIEPAVFAASQYFAHINHSPEASPRFSLVVDDGRSHLQGSSARYDLILSEPSNPWMAGLSNLFTREFYEAAKARLKPGGVLAQWIQTYNLTPASYAMIVKTVTSVFPHAGLVRLGKPDTLLLASDEPLEPDAETVAAAQRLVDQSDAVQVDLARWLRSTQVRDILNTVYVLDEVGLARLVETNAPAVLNTDANMRLEYEAAREEWADDPDLRGTVYWNVMASAAPGWFTELFELMKRPPEEVGILHTVALDFTELGLEDQAERLIEKGLEIDPTNSTLVADELLLAPPADRGTIAAALTAILIESQTEANDVAAALTRNGRLDLAAELYERILDTNPDSATTLRSLAGVYIAQDRYVLADEMLTRALALDPVDTDSLSKRAALRMRVAAQADVAAREAASSADAKAHEPAPEPVPATARVAAARDVALPGAAPDHQVAAP